VPALPRQERLVEPFVERSSSLPAAGQRLRCDDQSLGRDRQPGHKAESIFKRQLGAKDQRCADCSAVWPVVPVQWSCSASDWFGPDGWMRSDLGCSKAGFDGCQRAQHQLLTRLLLPSVEPVAAGPEADGAPPVVRIRSTSKTVRTFSRSSTKRPEPGGEGAGPRGPRPMADHLQRLRRQISWAFEAKAGPRQPAIPGQQGPGGWR